MVDNVSAIAVRDPAAASRLRRQQMAEALMRQGMETTPIQSPWQGVARLGQSLIGGLQSAQVQQETEDDRAQRDARRQALIGQLLGGGGGSAPSAPPMAPAAPQMPAQAPMQPPAMPAAAPRGEAPGAVAQGIAARGALDPTAPDYEQQIMAINNGVVGRTMPGMRPQPVPQAAPMPQPPAPQPAPGGAPVLDERTLMAMALSGDPELTQMAQGMSPFIQRRERNQDQETDREWRRQEAARAQANADRAFALQQAEARRAADAAARAAEGATRGQIPQGYRLTPAGTLERIPGFEPPPPTPSGAERDRARYIDLDARRQQLSPAEQVELAYLERQQTIPQVAAGPNGVAIVERPPLPSASNLQQPSAPQAAPQPAAQPGANVPLPGGGRASFVTGAGGPLTEAQSRSNMFGNAMEQAARQLEGLPVPSTPVQVAWRNLPEGLVNPALDENSQRYFNSLRSFAAGILRKETGAAFTTQELLDVQSRFFPLPGDSPRVIEQKAEARRQAIESMRAEVPGGFRGQVPTQAPATAPQGGGWSIRPVQ